MTLEKKIQEILDQDLGMPAVALADLFRYHSLEKTCKDPSCDGEYHWEKDEWGSGKPCLVMKEECPERINNEDTDN